MKLLLLLGVVFFGAEAESQEIQKLLASARQLNQTLGSLAGHTTKTRRLQSITIAPTAACEAACDGIQCAYDDSEDIGNRMSGGDALAALSAAGDSVGAVCFHRTAMTCAAGSTQCAGVVRASSLDIAPCICDACPNSPKIYEGMSPLITAMQVMASGGTPSAEEMDSLLTALCPMSSVLECWDSNSACSSVMAQTGLGSSLESLATMKSQCATAGKATSYATSYTFTSPTCSAQESSDADGLLQLNLLAGSFSLFSILN